MQGMLFRFLIIGSIIFLSGCAASYAPVRPPRIAYDSHDYQDGMDLAYKYDVLMQRRNKKYAKKEDLKNIKVVAVKITNTNEFAVNVREDLIFHAGEQEVVPMRPEDVRLSIRQFVPAYIPYLLLTLVNLNYSDGVTTETYPIGLVLGPSITFGNMAVASKANRNFLSELIQYDIMNKVIRPGETIYGLIGLHDVGYSPITVRLR